MLHPETPSGATFDRLLAAMPSIAEAVNGFASEENQSTALRALLRTFGLPDGERAGEKTRQPELSVVPSPGDDHPESNEQDEAGAGVSAEEQATRRRARRPGAKKSAPRAKDINFRPEGKQSLREFVEEKKPGNLQELNTVAVFYLKEVLGIDAIDVGHVLAAYIECGWRLPGNLENSLSVTACRTKWLNTSDRKAITLTNPGRNLVLLDLPRIKAKKSA
jgi:hypothetical protein